MSNPLIVNYNNKLRGHEEALTLFNEFHGAGALINQNDR